MFIRRLSFSGFRNLKEGDISPGQGVNILYGDNAQGKTNLLEACWLFTGGKSFRGAKDRECVSLSADEATLSLQFEAQEREQEATLHFGMRKTLSLNGVPQRAVSAITGRFCAVVFCPTHLQLISGAPDGRRRFMDAAYCQLRPGYAGVMRDCQRVLTQRNALLKLHRDDDLTKTQLDIWDARMAEAAAKVTLARLAYLKKLAPLATAFYDGLSGGREQMTLSLSTQVETAGVTLGDLAAQYRALLQKSRAVDMAAGFSTVGAHREDLCLDIDAVSAGKYASQGQQRSAVLALKLSEATLLKEISGEQPVALLDDVMSELDVARQDYILNHIGDWQVLITCCDPVAIERQTGGKVFHIQNGKIVEK